MGAQVVEEAKLPGHWAMPKKDVGEAEALMVKLDEDREKEGILAQVNAATGRNGNGAGGMCSLLIGVKAPKPKTPQAAFLREQYCTDCNATPVQLFKCTAGVKQYVRTMTLP